MVAFSDESSLIGQGESFPIDSNPYQLDNSLTESALTTSETTELFFIDQRVKNYQNLITGLDSEVDLVFLERDRDGIEQISSILAQQQQVDAIHLISHGSVGSLQLGATTLNQDNLSEYQDDLLGWQAALTPDADILLYGCNTAEGETGQAFVDQLSTLTGADVAASDDLTGNSSQGGDWQLEYQVGEIEATGLVGDNSFAGVLGAVSLANNKLLFDEGVTDDEIKLSFENNNLTIREVTGNSLSAGEGITDLDDKADSVTFNWSNLTFSDFEIKSDSVAFASDLFLNGANLTVSAETIIVNPGVTLSTRQVSSSDHLHGISVGNSGNVTFTVNETFGDSQILIGEAGKSQARILTHATTSDNGTTTYTSGDITFGVAKNVVGSVVVDIDTANSKIELNNTKIQGGKVTLTAQAGKSLSFDQDSPETEENLLERLRGTFGTFFDDESGGTMQVVAGVVVAESTAEVLVNSSQIDATDLTISATAKGTGQINPLLSLSFGVGVGVGDIDSTAKAIIDSNSTINTTNKFTLNSTTQNDLNIIASPASISGSSVLGAAAAVSVSNSDMTSIAQIASGATVNAKDLAISAKSTESHTVEAEAAATEDGRLGVAVAVSDSDSTTEALVDGVVTATGNIDISATSEKENTTQAVAKTGSDLLDQTVGKLANDMAWLNLADFNAALSGVIAESLTERLTKKFGNLDFLKETGLSASVAIANDLSNTVARIGDNATITSQADIAVKANAKITPHIDASAVANSKVDPKTFNLASRDYAGSGSVQVSNFDTTAKAYIGKNATVDVAKNLTVASKTEYPYDPMITAFFLEGLGDATSSAPTLLGTAVDNAAEGWTGGEGNSFTSWSRSAATGGQELGLGVSVSSFDINNTSSAYIDEGARINQNSSADPSTVTVKATSDVNTVNVAGVLGIPIIEDRLGQPEEVAGVGGTVLVIDNSNNVSAVVHDGVKLNAKTLEVDATTTAKQLTIGVSGGKAETFGVNGTVAVLGIENNTIAQIDSGATIVTGADTIRDTARTVIVNATDDSRIIAISGGVAMAKNVGIGFSVGVNDIKRNTQAVIGNLADAETQAIVNQAVTGVAVDATTITLETDSAGSVTSQGNIDVKATNDGYILGLALAGATAINTGTTQTPKNNLTVASPSSTNSSQTTTSVFSKLKQALGGVYVTVSGEWLDNDINDDTKAYIKNANVNASSIEVNATNDTDIWALAGGFALNYTANSQTNTKASVGISGAWSDNFIGGTTAAYTEQSILTLEANFNVSASTTRDIRALAASGSASINTTTNSSFSGTLAGSVTNNELNNETLAYLKGTTAEALNLTVKATDTSAILSGAGAVAITWSSGKGSPGGSVGLSWADNDGSSTTLAYLENSQVKTSGTIDIAAKNNSEINTFSATLGATNQTAAITASVTVNDITNTTKSYISGGTVAQRDSNPLNSLSLSATDTSQIGSIAGQVGIADKAGVGFAFAWNDIENQTDSYITDAAEVKDVEGAITVKATSDSEIETYALGGSFANKGAVAGSTAINFIQNSTNAHLTGASLTTGTDLKLTAKDTSTLSAIAGGIAGSKDLAFGAAVAINDIGSPDRGVQAYISGGNLTATGNILLDAQADTEILAVTVGGSGASSFSLGGSVSVNDLSINPQAHITGGAMVNADGSIALTANSNLNLDLIAGGVGLSSGSAVGVGTTILTTNNTVKAYIEGNTTQVNAQGNGTGVTIFNGEKDNQGTRLTTTVNGLAVIATAFDDIQTIAAAGGIGGGAAGIAGAATVNSIINTTQAYIDQGITVNQTLTNANTAQSVEVFAWDDSETTNVAGSVGIAGGAAGVAGGVDVGVIDKTTQAYINSSAQVNAQDSIGVRALSSGEITSVSASLGIAGTAGVAGSVGVSVINETTQAYIGNQAIITAKGNIVVDADSRLELDLVAGSGGFGGTAGVGFSASVPVINKNTEAYIGQNAQVTALGQTDGVLVKTGDFDSQYLPVEPSTFAETGVNLADDTIRFSGGHGFSTGDAVVFYQNASGSIAGLTDQQTYYVIVINNETIQLAQSLADTRSYLGTQPTPIDLTSASGSGHILQSLEDLGKSDLSSATTYSFEDSQVDISNDQINFQYEHGLATGQAFIYDNEDGAVISGLEKGKTYYAIVDSDKPKAFQFAASVEDAEDGKEIDLTSVGTGSKHRVSAIPNNSFSSSGVNLSNDTITFTDDHGLVTGQAITYSNADGNGIGGLENGQTYYVIAEDGDPANDIEGNPKVLRLATSRANAEAGIAINLTSQGIGNKHRLLLAPDGKRVTTPITQLVKGLAVTATSTNDMMNIAAAGGGAGTAGVSLGASVYVLNNQTRAYIDSNAQINQENTAAGTEQSVHVIAGTDFAHLGVAGSLALGGVAGIGPGANVTVVDNLTEAYIGDAALVNAQQDVQVEAIAKGDIFALAATAAGGGAVAIAGSAAVFALTNQTYTFLGQSSQVNAGGNVWINAQDDTTVESIAGSLGIGLGIAGVGASAGVVVIEKDTQAYISDDAIIDAAGNGGTTLKVINDDLDSDPRTIDIQGIGIQATSTEDILTIAASGGGGLFVGAAGSVAVTNIDADTKAFIGQDAQLNQNNQENSSLEQTVHVVADNQSSLLAIAGSIAGGAVGISGGVDVGTIQNHTTAYIDDGSLIFANQDVTVNAFSDQEVDSYAVSAAGGLVGIAGSVSVYGIGAELGEEGKKAISGTFDDSVVIDQTEAEEELGFFDDWFGELDKGYFRVDDHGFEDNEAVIFNSGGGYISGLTDGRTYYVIKEDDDIFQLASSPDGDVIEITAAQGDKFSFSQLGSTTSSADGYADSLFKPADSLTELLNSHNSSSELGQLRGNFGSRAQTEIQNATATNRVANALSRQEVEGTVAFIGKNVTVATGDDINVKADATLDFNALTGQIAVGFAGIGGSVVVANLDNTVLAYADEGSQLTAGNDLNLNAIATETINGYAFGGQAGAISLGAAVSTIDLERDVRAFLGNNTTVQQANTVNVTANSTANLTSRALNASIGAVAVGLTKANLVVTGFTSASLGNGVNIVNTQNLTVQAQSQDTATTETEASTGGIFAGSGTISKVTVAPTVEAYIGANNTINLNGDALIDAKATGKVTAKAGGESLGGVSVGVSAANATWQPTVFASVGDLTQLSANNITIQATTPNDIDNVTKATANPSAGSLLGSGVGASADININSHVFANIGQDANLTAGNNLTLAANTYNSGDAEANGKSIGLFIGAGSSTALVRITNITQAITEATATLNAGNKITLNAQSEHHSLSNAVAGAGGTIATGGSIAWTSLTNNTTAELGDRAQVNPNQTIGSLEIQATSTIDSETKVTQEVDGLAVDNYANGFTYVSSSTCAFLGEEANVNVRNFTLNATEKNTSISTNTIAETISAGSDVEAQTNQTATLNTKAGIGKQAKINASDSFNVLANQDLDKISAQSTVTAYGVGSDEAISRNTLNATAEINADKTVTITTESGTERNTTASVTDNPGIFINNASDYDSLSQNDELEESEDNRSAINKFETNVGINDPVVRLLTDEDDGNYNDSDLSLREAIKNATPGSRISFGFVNPGNVITLDQNLGTLVIDKDLTIDGDQVRMTLSGGNRTRIFRITDSDTNSKAKVTLSGLDLIEGSSFFGGAIINIENLTLLNVNLTQNTANTTMGGQGGAIYNSTGGILSLEQTTLQNNQASLGGAIFNDGGTVTVTDSIIQNNFASSNGGGIYTTNNGKVEITSSSLTNNRANYGGAIFNSVSEVTLAQATLSGNSATTSGGAIFQGTGSTTNIHNSTITLNTATSGSGVFSGGTNAQVRVLSSIIAGNANSDDVAGNTFISENYNLIGGGDAANQFGLPTTDTQQDPIDAVTDGTTPATYVFLTDSLAKELSTSGNGLPDNGVFAANADHPEVILGYGSRQEGDNAIRVLGKQSVTHTLVDTEQNNYQSLHLFTTSTQGATEIEVQLIYTDGSTASIVKTIPDWFDDPGTDSYVPDDLSVFDEGIYLLTNGLDRVVTENLSTNGLQNANDAAIFGVQVDIDTTKQLQKVTVVNQDEPTNSQGEIDPSNLIIFGMTGETTTGTAVQMDVSALFNKDVIANKFTRDQVGVSNPKLAPLALSDNGTLMHALLSDSPAIDTGGNPDNLPVDGRGVFRVSGFGVDIGAYELQTDAIVVSTVVDSDDELYDEGNLSLREALAYSESGTVITFSPELANETITLGNGELIIDRNLTLEGGSNNITIDAQRTSRVFRVDDGDAQNQLNVTLNYLTITGGRTLGEGGGILNYENLTINNSILKENTITGLVGGGGGLFNYQGTVTLNNSKVSDNSGQGLISNGGGIYNRGGTVTLSNSTVSRNLASNDGGGIYNYLGTVVLNLSQVSGNLAPGLLGFGDGGGIYNNSGTITLNTSTVSGNAANDDGGGLYNQQGTLNIYSSTVSSNFTGDGGGGLYNDQGTVKLINSTISGNSASATGGGIYNNRSSALEIRNSTITNNQASSGSGVYNYNISLFGENFKVMVESSIIAGNTNNTDVVGNVYDTFASKGYNLIGGGNQTNSFNHRAIDLAQDSFDANNYSLITDEVAKELDATNGNGLPSNGFFAANANHPDVELTYGLNQGGNNARISRGQESFQFSVPANTYNEMHLFALSTEGSSDMRVEFTYSDGTKANFNKTVPDWFNDPTTSNTYTLIDGLDRVKATGSNLEDVNDPAIFGFKFTFNSSKTLDSIKIINTNTASSSSRLVFFGATGVTAANGTVQVDVSSVLDKDVIVDKTNILTDRTGITDPRLAPLANNGGDTQTHALLVDSPGLDAGSNSDGLITDQRGESRTFGSQSDIGAFELQNNAPTLSLENTVVTLTEATNTSNPVKVADILITDEGLGTNNLSLTGTDAAKFEIIGTELYLKAGTVLDYETQSQLQVTVAVNDPTVGSNPDSSTNLEIAITDINEAPTVSLQNPTTSITDTLDTSIAQKVADIIVSDDALGANNLTLTGTDSYLFEIQGDALYLQAGKVLNGRTNPQLEVNVVVDDPSLGATVEDTASLSIPVIPNNLEVDTGVDENDGDFSIGDLSLREALEFLNDGGTITFSPTLTGQTLILTQGELIIDKSVTMNGNGIILSGDNTQRIFTIDNGRPSLANVSLSGFTLAGGYSAGNGGAILTQENLTLTNSTIYGNSAEVGGAIALINSTLSLSQVTLSGNTANTEGGAIFASGSLLNLNNSTITNNGATTGSGILSNNSQVQVASSIIAGNANDSDVVGSGFTSRGYNLIGGGDAVANFGEIDRVQDSLDDNNFALLTDTAAKILSVNGQGLPDHGFFPGNADHPAVQLAYTDQAQNARIANPGESFSFSTPEDSYSRIDLFFTATQGDASMQVEFSYTDGTTATFNRNVPDWFNDTLPADTYYLINNLDRAKGDGTGFEDSNNPAIFGLRFDLDGTKQVQSVTVTNNDTDGSYLVFFGGTGSANTTVQFDVASIFNEDVIIEALFDQTGVTNPQLTPLQDNGNGVLTHGLLPNSPAIDAGNNSQGLTSDQRGLTRIQGGGIDIGAVEMQPISLDLSPNEAGINHSTQFIETGVVVGTGDVAITPSLTISDADLGDTITTITVTLTNPLDGDSEGLSLNGTFGSIGTVEFNSANEIVLTGLNATHTEVESLLKAITYNNSSDTPDENSRAIHITLGDGIFASPVAITTVTVTATNDAPTISNTTVSLDENSAVGTTVTTVTANDPEGALTYALTSGNTDADGDNITPFTIDVNTGEITVTDADDLDFETTTSFNLGVSVTDTEGVITNGTVAVNLTDVNEPPTLSLQNQLITLTENLDTSTPVKVADLLISDDGLGTNTLVLSGTDAAKFEIIDTGLFLKAGTVLDYESQTQLQVTVAVEDTTLNAVDTQTLTIAIADIAEFPEINLKQSANNLASGSTYDFGSIGVNSGSTEYTFTLENTGNAPLNLSDMTLSGTHASDFSLVGNTPLGELTAGATVTFTLRYDPNASGDSTATLTLLSNDGDESTYILTLTGTAIETTTITGTNGDDTINSGGGDNTIDVGDGNDLVNGGSGGEYIKLGSGNDTAYGNDGNDRIYGEGGQDLLYGGAGRDLLRGGDDNDQLFGGEGDDYLIGDAGNDYLEGGAGNDRLRGGTGSDTFVLSANQGTDTIYDFDVNADHFELKELQVSDLSFADNGFYGLIKVGEQIIAQVRYVSAAQLAAYFQNRY